MPHGPKIATCCYCGTRAALTLRGRERHELACSTCGAPLSELKMLKSDARGERALVRPTRKRVFGWQKTPKSRRKIKKSRSLSQRFMSEVWDVAEDIFDEIFD
ncbi:MAG: hypothetical protein HKN18_12260 [Silicimonas sp.]|nr:hypothetical protein [Silicimonas sp.]